MNARLNGFGRQLTPSVLEAMAEVRADYAAMKASRFRRRRDGLSFYGSGADYHYRNEGDYLKLIEYARDMDRNDALVGQITNRAVSNTIQGGFQPDPQTGDAAVDAALFEWFDSWARDPQACDISGRLSFIDIQRLVLRATIVDGDVFALPLDTGQLQLVESHRCRTPSGAGKSIIHGVRLSSLRQRVSYCFVQDDIDPWQSMTSDLKVIEYPAYDSDGSPLVFHVFKPSRATQTRGVTAYAPVFDLVGMIEDINFAKLVQQQVVSCFGFIATQTQQGGLGSGPQFGSRSEVTNADGTTQTVENIQPGMIVPAPYGVEYKEFSPSIPNPEYFEQFKLTVTLVGVNLGLPWVMVMMDASDTNFSGWRGAVDQARMGFEDNQRWLRDQLHIPVYRWQVRRAIASDRALRSAAARLGPAIYRCTWTTPRWRTIQPLQDAQADTVRLEKLLTSPRRLHAERGQDFDEIRAETIEDNKRTIIAAIEAAREVRDQTGQDIDYRCFINLSDTTIKATVDKEVKVEQDQQEETQ